MRKRKLYLSEFLKRHEHKYSSEVHVYAQNGYGKDFKNFEEAIEYFEEQSTEIHKWTYNETLGYIIILK